MNNFDVVYLDTIQEALDNQNHNFDFLRKVFKRACTLYHRNNPHKEFTQLIKEWVEEKIEIDLILDSYPSKILKRQSEDVATDNLVLIDYFSLKAIYDAYRHCRSAECQNNNSFHKLIFGEVKDTHNYLIDVLDCLAMLEDISTQNHTSSTVNHFVKKAMEKTTKKERAPRSKGGFIKAENERKRAEPIKKEAIRLFKNQTYKTKHNANGQKPFARHFALQYNFELKKNNPDVPDKDLDYLKESSVEKWIKDYLEQC